MDVKQLQESLLRQIKRNKKMTTAQVVQKMREAHVARAKQRDKERAKLVEKAVSGIHKQFGTEAIGFVTDRKVEKLECVSTGLKELDDLLTGDADEKTLATVPGSGQGVPRGRIVEVFGPESAGKTTIALEMIKAFQKAGYLCAFIDAEHSIDLAYAARTGVNVQELLFSQPDSAEEAVSIMTALARAGTCGLVVLDSVSAMVPAAERETDEYTSGVGVQARLMSNALRKLVSLAAKTKTTILFINQIRMKIGVRWGNPETTSGGQALKFYASIRIDVRRTQTLKKGDKFRGIRSRVKTVKNKVASPHREIHVDISRGKGITAAYAEMTRKKGTSDDE